MGTAYLSNVIQSFADKATAAVFQGLRVSRWPLELQVQSRKRLIVLDQAKSLNDLRVMPSHRLEKLKGNRQGQWSVRVNRQWRICFTWHNGHAVDVELVDYH